MQDIQWLFCFQVLLFHLYSISYFFPSSTSFFILRPNKQKYEIYLSSAIYSVGAKIGRVSSWKHMRLFFAFEAWSLTDNLSFEHNKPVKALRQFLAVAKRPGIKHSWRPSLANQYIVLVNVIVLIRYKQVPKCRPLIYLYECLKLLCCINRVG